MTHDLEQLITEAEYAQLRRCSRRTLQRERASRAGAPYVLFGTQVRYRLSDVQAFVKRHVVGGPTSGPETRPTRLPKADAQSRDERPT
jgi:hypothetical protein